MKLRKDGEMIIYRWAFRGNCMLSAESGWAGIYDFDKHTCSHGWNMFDRVANVKRKTAEDWKSLFRFPSYPENRGWMGEDG